MRTHLKSTAIGLTCSILASVALAKDEVVASLEDLKWEFRLLLIMDTQNQSEVLDTLRQSRTEIVDRDLAWFVFSKDSVSSNFEKPLDPKFVQSVRKKFFDSQTANTVLIGKDGSVKSTSVDLKLGEIFSLIDSMPMRRAEMGRKSTE